LPSRVRRERKPCCRPSVWRTETCSAANSPVWSKTVQPSKNTSLDQGASCQRDVITPTLELANETEPERTRSSQHYPCRQFLLDHATSYVCGSPLLPARVIAQVAILAVWSCNSFAVERRPVQLSWFCNLDFFCERSRLCVGVASCYTRIRIEGSQHRPGAHMTASRFSVYNPTTLQRVLRLMAIYF